jgi:peptidoglycan-associated lipoprotein
MSPTRDLSLIWRVPACGLDQLPIHEECSMSPIPLRLCAALLLLAGCASDDAPDQSAAGAGAGAGAGIGGAGAGIASSELAGQPVPGTQEDLAVSVGDRVFFDYDSVVLNAEATRVLDGQAAWLKQYPDVVITIEGHADERGTREYNLALGDRRANAVRNYLMALGIDQERILTISYGEERPADPGHDESAWAQNRRAVTTVATTG